MFKKIAIAAVAGVLMLAAVPQALGAEWSIDKMNQTVDQVSFIVNDNCSGTLIGSTDRLVLTNYHCAEAYITFSEREVTDSEGVIHKVKVRQYLDMQVSQKTFDGFAQTGVAAYTAVVAYADKTVDLALLKIKGPIPNKQSALLIDSKTVVGRGERIYIVGNPAGYTATVVEGVVANVNRTFKFPWTNNEELPMIQTSGGIYGGNSGGTLFNADGRMIGVPAAKAGQTDFIGLAIPVNEVVKPFLIKGCYVPNGAEFKDGAVNATGQVVYDDKCAAAKKKAKAKKGDDDEQYEHGRPAE